MKGVCKSFILAQLSVFLIASFHTPACLAAPGSQAGQNKSPQNESLRVSQAFCSDNLAVYLIHGKDKIQNQKILTLEEALEKKLVAVEETSDVNNLRVSNKSDSIVFLQSGDIVRGGKQDRAIQYDMMLAPRAKNLPLQVFCVEHGRWQQRGPEPEAQFSKSQNQLASKDLKLAAKKIGSQGSVWEKVSSFQGALSQRLGSSVCAPPSPSSLELSFDNSKLKAASGAHEEKLKGIINGQTDVVGYAFAINGKINSADVYASNELFKKLWPKLLKASATEAVAEKAKGSSAAPAPNEILRFLSEAENKPCQSKAKNQISETTEQESSSSLVYKTRWYSAPARVQVLQAKPQVSDYRDVHVNYLAK